MDDLEEAERLADLEAAACTGKESFETYAAAKRVADRPRIKNPQHLEVYRCEFCRKFHLSSKNLKKKRHHGSRKKRTIRL